MFGGGGGNPPPYPFPKPPSSTTGSEQPPASTTTVFGQATGAPGTFGQPSALFGHTPTTAGWGAPAGSTPAPGGAVFGNSQSIGSNPFGQQPTPSAGAPTSMPTFGSQNQPPSSSSLFGQSESSGASFGQPPSTAAPAFSLSAGTTFGSAAGPGSAGFQPSTAPVFGATLGTRKSSTEAKPSSGAAHSVAASTFADQAGSTIRSLFGAGGTDSASSAASAGTSLFGKGAGGADPAGGSLFGKAPDGAATADGPSLFGKAPGGAGSAGSSSAAGASLFGKAAGGTGLFGKQKAATDSGVDAPPAAPLFGKTSSETAGLFGKPKRTPSADTDETDAAAPPSSRPAGAPGLFGKTASGADSASSAPALFAKEGRSAGSAPALFRKEGRSEPAAAPPSGRLRSVFTQPDGPAPTSKRRPATSLTEASRRSLARTGLFGKPPEARTVDKSPVTGPAGPRVQRLNSAEELQQVTSLLCTDVPEGNNDRTILTRHFSKFGQVVKVTCNKAKNTASIHFADHAAADAAKRRGARVHPKLPPMSLYFRRPVKSAAAEPARRRPPPLDDDVSDELRNMAGTGDTRDPPRRAELPPEPKPRRAEAPPEPKARRTPAAATATVPAPSAVPAAAAAPAAAVNVSELRALLRQPAALAGDRFRVLDARDKLQRAALRREGPARSGPLVGTCPDMCPEKERYMREEKHQISGQYERDRDRQGGFEMDHRLAVKQYSRSSADQEEPLPHELRTPAALLRTMDYLVTHVTDAETRDTGDWFHFIWDRTRGIRKDITQQQLTDQVSVGLVEKCARFHVHCAAALCELSRDMFDQKINNENLTKCLQTLKHMYHDLSLKGVRCEREAEFRAYDILLNLNQGDTLREAQTYSDEVRESPEVQAALRLYVALSSNNYVRFFKLVRRAGYLASCLLQRYFNQVRTRALDVITRTYCPAKAVVEFPLAQLQEMLGFESEQECASALRQHGIESEEGTAFLERVQFQVPDTPPELRRCPTLIDAKRELSIGQAIQGGPLPADPLPSYRPHDSFDAHGVLRRTAWDAQDQGGVEPAAEAAPPPADEGERAAEAAAGQLVTEVVTEETRRQAAQLLAAAAAARQLCAQLFQATVDEVVKEMVRSVSQSELAEARRLQEEQKQLQEQRRREAEERRARELQEQERARRDQEMKDRLSSVLTETLIAEVCLDETADIAEQEMLTVQAKHSAVAAIHLRLWTEGADRLARRTAEEVLAECRRQRQALIHTLTEIGHRLTLRRMLGRWRRSAEDGRRLRAEQRLFPAGRPLHDAATALRLLGGPKEPPHPPADLWTDGSLCSLLLHDRLSTQPVSVAAVLSRSGRTAAPSSGHLLWKLAVPAPAGCPLTQWLLGKLDTDGGRTVELPDGVLQRESVRPPGGGRLSICVRQLEGRPAEAVGAAGLLLAYSGPESAGRLHQLLDQLPREPLLPLAVLVEAGGQRAALAQLRLPERLAAGAVTTYRLFELLPGDGVQSGETLVSALEWLFEHRPAPPPLRAARLRHLAQDFLGVQVTRRLYTDLQARRNKKRVEQSPVAAVSLYNAAVRHLSAVLSSGSLPDLSWPPAELVELTDGVGTERPESALPPPGWNRPERLLQIQQEVSALSLPPVDVDVDWSWTECCAKVLQYVGRLSDWAGDGTPALYRVRSLLRDRLQLLRRAAWPLDEDVGDQPLSASLPWTDIVQCCIEVRTDQLSGSEEVYYLPDELDNFRVPDVWTEYTSVGHTGECLTLDESVTIAKRSLDTSLDVSPAVKRRPERHSFGRPTLDVSTHIDRELNVSLDWEQRLRELVDEGDASGAMAPPPPPPPVHLTPPRTGRRASLERQLCQLRAQLSADRRHTEQLDRLLAAAAGGTELPPALVGSPE